MWMLFDLSLLERRRKDPLALIRFTNDALLFATCFLWKRLVEVKGDVRQREVTQLKEVGSAVCLLHSAVISLCVGKGPNLCLGD